MRSTYLTLVLVAILNIGCGETSEPDICNPAAGRMIKGVHYIEAEFLTEEGLWNYSRWVEYYTKYIKTGRSAGCIPLKENSTLADQINELEKTIDLRR